MGRKRISNREVKKMAKKKEWKKPILMIIYWAIYLTLTMALFERYHITPELVGGAIGWTVIVEIPRVAIGYGISIPLFKKIK